FFKFCSFVCRGNYGAGKVMIWDQGDFDLEKREADEIVFYLHGKKLTGRYALIKLNKQGENWLVFKTADV
ncbi:MAG: DNA polymerase ligase N-terminal domain-containing protein, partial [bacterium]|nr:DNA polymerase ligase N-terminal domain-containing protein [bacterium]